MPRNRVTYLWGRKWSLPVDPEDKKVQRVFTRGQCHSFALALHKLTGWELAVLCYDDFVGDDVLIVGMDAENAPYPPADGDHVICIRPDGYFVDIYGAWLPGERWHSLRTAVVVPAEEVLNLGWDAVLPEKAMPFAKALLPMVQVPA